MSINKNAYQKPMHTELFTNIVQRRYYSICSVSSSSYYLTDCLCTDITCGKQSIYRGYAGLICNNITVFIKFSYTFEKSCIRKSSDSSENAVGAEDFFRAVLSILNTCYGISSDYLCRNSFENELDICSFSLPFLQENYLL